MAKQIGVRATILVAAIGLSAFGCSGGDGGSGTTQGETTAGETTGGETTGGETTGGETTGGETTGGETTGGQTTGGETTGETGGETTGSTTGAPADRLSVSATLALEGYARTGGSIIATPSGIATCDHTQIHLLGADGAITASVDLPASCITLAADDTGVVAATTDGQWHFVTGQGQLSSVAGPWPLGMTIRTGTIYAALGADGVMSAPADLSAAPTTLPGAEDARAVYRTDGPNVLVADGRLGLKLIDATGAGVKATLAPPMDNSMATSIAALSASRFAIGMAGFGLWIVDVNGDQLTEVSAFPVTGNLHLGIAATQDGSHVMTADWLTARLWDVSDAASPKYVAREFFGADRAIGVAFYDGHFWTAGIQHMTRLTPDPTTPTAEMYIAEHELQVESVEQFNGIGSAALLVYNWGGVDLHLSNLAATSPRVTVGQLPDSGVPGVDVVIPPGDIGFLELTINGTEPEDSTFTFNTNDPDYATTEIAVRINPPRLHEGDALSDFVTPSVSGHMVRVADYIGAVHLKLFNAY